MKYDHTLESPHSIAITHINMSAPETLIYSVTYNKASLIATFTIATFQHITRKDKGLLLWHSTPAVNQHPTIYSYTIHTLHRASTLKTHPYNKYGYDIVSCILTSAFISAKYRSNQSEIVKLSSCFALISDPLAIDKGMEGEQDTFIALR